jgi:hypothetical protein
VKYSAYSSETNAKTTFGIFEGVNLTPEYEYSKKLTLAAYYDSYKYCNHVDNNIGWGYAPVLEVATKDKPCEKTVDTYVEDKWWSLCTKEEKEKAIEILEKQYNIKWDEENMALIDMKSGEILHKIITPKLEYLGDTIKPICSTLKSKLKKFVVSKNKNNYSTGGYPCYNNAYCHGMYDDYDNFYD